MEIGAMDRRGFLGAAGMTVAAAAVTGVAGTALASEAAAGTGANRVCEILGIEKPVIGASMAWGTSPELVAAVSNAGGLGMLGLYPDKVEYPEGVDPAELDMIEKTRYAIRDTKTRTDKPFCVTYGVLANGQDRGGKYDYFDMLIEEGANILYVYGMGTAETGHAVDTDTLEELKEEGFTVIYRDVCPTIESMLAAQEAGVDIIACSGYGQGGHITDTRITNFSMLVAARPVITVPLIANGQVVDADTANAVALLGAEGCIVGTRLNASVESPYAEPFKQAIVDAKAEEAVEWRATIGYWHHTPCEIATQCVELDKAGAERSEIGAVYCGADARYETIYGTDVAKYGVSINDTVDRITSIKPVQEIVDEIASAWL